MAYNDSAALQLTTLLTVAGLHTSQETCESVLVPFTPAVCECLASFAGGIVEVALK